VFPLIPGGKTPALATDWRAIATTDPERIRELWWDPHMDVDQPYNVGIATGDGLVVLDVDNKNGKDGESALRLLEMFEGELPETRQVITASGSRHLYFRCGQPVGCSHSGIGEGLDIKGDGGFVVGPGSVIGGAEYRWAA
jgi:hypothetical protein